MCDTCGCNVTPGNEHLVAAGGHLAKTSTGHESVEVLKGLLDANDHQAGHNREHFARHRALAVNLMSSPGAGKTALL
ncbi:MAG: hydrogenase accessory protein HypB, partial [Gammaproteobacteria bacterium]|nr:hydrogenase accessory protein HypB [Gammaproteobacteria bacterium]